MPSSFYPFLADLILTTTLTAATLTGDTKTVKGVVNNENQQTKASFSLTQVNTGGVAGIIQGSWDGGTTWVTLATMTPLAAAGARAQLVDLPVVAPKCRAVLTLSGAANVAIGARVAIVSTNGVSAT